MKAVIVKEAGVLEVQDLPEPEPEPDQIKIKIAYAGSSLNGSKTTSAPCFLASFLFSAIGSES